MNHRSGTGGSILRAAVAIVALGVLLVLPSQAFAAGGGWQAQASPTTQDLNGIATSEGQTWAVGASGTIIATQGDAASWAAQASNTTQDLRAVAFADSSHGWAVGDGGTILETSDGGATWTPQSSGTVAALYGIACSGPSTAWVVGAGGTILETSDGGATWTPQSSGTVAALYGIACSGPSTAWVVGAGGTIIATQGSASWVAQTSTTTQDLRAVAFADGSHGWAVGAGGTILETSDGGATWVAQASHDTRELEGVAFSNAAHGWVVGAGGTIIHTADGGGAWAAQASNTTQDLADVAFADAEHGFVAGTDGTIRTTGDGGIHDTVPPGTIARGLRASRSSGWRNTSQTVTLHASDSGSGVAATYYTLDGEARQTYQAPFSVSGAGSHLVRYWSVDWAGNVEAKHTGFVNIDTNKPICVALRSVRTWSGTVARLAYRVNEPGPNCGKAFVTITIYRENRPLKRIKLSRVQLNQRHVYAYTVRLRAGSYTWVVTATDVAGNTQASEGEAKLKVIALPLPTVSDVQRRLVALKYLPADAVSGRNDYRTSQALMAFQAWSGLPRDGVADVQTRMRLATAAPPRPRRESVSGHYIEVFRSLGVVLCVDSGSLVRAVHCSTGRPSLPTPAGEFSVYSKSLDAFSTEYDSWMPYASFFRGGDALHGYPDVPAYPASHGCVRLSMPEASWVYAFATLGTPVFVY